MGGQRTAEEALRELDVTENNIGALLAGAQPEETNSESGKSSCGHKGENLISHRRRLKSWRLVQF